MQLTPKVVDVLFVLVVDLVHKAVISVFFLSAFRKEYGNISNQGGLPKSRNRVGILIKRIFYEKAIDLRFGNVSAVYGL